jgi:hypothetical protein
LKNKKKIQIRIAAKRFLYDLRRRLKKKEEKRRYYIQLLKSREELKGDLSQESIFRNWLPANITYLINCEKSDFFIEKLKSNIPENNGIFKVPEVFSIIDNAQASYKFIQQITASLLLQRYSHVKIDYIDCERIDLGTHVLFDIILKDIISFIERCGRATETRSKVMSISGVNFEKEKIKNFFFL